MAIQISQVATGGGSFVKTTELRNYPFVVVEIERMIFNAPGYQGKGTTTKVFGNFLCFDAQHKVVHEVRGGQWDCGTNIGSKLPTQHPATVAISIKKEFSQKQQKDFNNLYNVGSPDIEPIVAELERREAEIQKAMDDAPSF